MVTLTDALIRAKQTLQEAMTEMRSSKPYVIEVAAIGDHPIPPFIGVIHRHFQKALPPTADAKEVTLIAPVDLLNMIVPADILSRIESIEVVYRRP